MALYQAIIAYDGTNFRGFQRQERTRTVQGEIERALKEIGWVGSSIYAAGRTDAGVHASGQVVAFELNWKHTRKSLRDAINDHLPDDVITRHVKEASEGFHPRYNALLRKYVYRIYCQEVRNPLLDRYAWWVRSALDLKLMKKAADLLVGSHDFRMFGKPMKKNGNTVRKVISADWSRLSEEKLFFMICANAFLYHMVRRLVFILVRIGQERILIKDFEDGMTNKYNNLLPGIAPACGLELTEVVYNEV